MISIKSDLNGFLDGSIEVMLRSKVTIELMVLVLDGRTKGKQFFGYGLTCLS